MFPALLLSIVYVRLAAVLRVSQGGSVIVGVPPLTSASGRHLATVWGKGAGRAGPVRGAVCSCATIVGGSPRGILDLMRGRGRGSLGVVDGTS